MTPSKPMPDPSDWTPSRLQFLFDTSLRTFCYGSPHSPHARGAGLAVECYNPFTDKVTVRRSYLGYVTGVETMCRSDYWSERMDFAPQDRRETL